MLRTTTTHQSSSYSSYFSDRTNDHHFPSIYPFIWYTLRMQKTRHMSPIWTTATHRFPIICHHLLHICSVEPMTTTFSSIYLVIFITLRMMFPLLLCLPLNLHFHLQFDAKLTERNSFFGSDREKRRTLFGSGELQRIDPMKPWSNTSRNQRRRTTGTGGYWWIVFSNGDVGRTNPRAPWSNLDRILQGINEWYRRSKRDVEIRV